MDIKEIIKEKLKIYITDWQERSARRIYFSVRKEDIVAVTKVLFTELGLRFAIASGVDTPLGLEILYHFSFDKTGQMYSVRVLIPDKEHPEIDSLATIFPAAEWVEREMWELLGINFRGHPNLKRLLLADDWPEGNYPLRNK